MLASAGADGKRTQDEGGSGGSGIERKKANAVAAKVQLAIFRQTTADPAE